VNEKSAQYLKTLIGSLIVKSNSTDDKAKKFGEALLSRFNTTKTEKDDDKDKTPIFMNITDINPAGEV
jgi:hypothetical protein